MVSASNTIVRHQASSNRNRTTWAIDPQPDGRRLPSPGRWSKQPRPSTRPQRHPLSALTKHISLQAPGFAAWAQAGLEQKSALPVRAVIRCTRFGRITYTPSTSYAGGRELRRRSIYRAAGTRVSCPPATGAAGANRTSRRRSAMRLSPLSSPKQWLKSLHSVHTGVVHKMRPSSSQSVR